MKILRFESDDRQIYTGCDFDGRTAAILEGNLLEELAVTGTRKAVKNFLPPLSPRAIFCIGLNYRLHARETGLDLPEYPVLFMKNPGAATGHLGDIHIPSCCADVPEVDYEAELAVIIRTPARNVTASQALDHVLGYACANDISARRWQKHAGGHQWVRGKSFDTFCPFGPWIVTPDELADPGRLEIECALNGAVMQHSNTSDMIFSVAEIISYLSCSTTLLPGTLILTGTPSGVGFARKPPVYLQPGDVLETKIQHIGTLKNFVRKERGGQANEFGQRK